MVYTVMYNIKTEATRYNICDLKNLYIYSNNLRENRSNVRRFSYDV